MALAIAIAALAFVVGLAVVIAVEMRRHDKLEDRLFDLEARSAKWGD
jgi:hypothetical protein